MYKVRSDEPKYAFLWDKETKQVNRYGKPIELVSEESELHGKSLNINGDNGIGDNPNRYKQHGFYLNADNCIGCHACEAACSEKNDNPAHIAFRSVGFVEGGTYPAYQRLNISMACNHCDDPVCLKGCPTRAYTKYAEYGAVLQDPEICFGCGYCTWVCPYNAPQLDPVKGQVSKCNMCVDRLEVGLKPACVSACLGNALDFGVVENVPENREECKSEIPGFPSADITNPNIRFQQKRQTHREMTRTDSASVKYHKEAESGQYKSVVDKKHGQARQWNWKKLLMTHESSHVTFTLATQAVVGAFMMLFLGGSIGISAISSVVESSGYSLFLIALLVLLTYGLFKLNMHLGKPHRFYRGFNNLRHSPVSREIAGVSLFFGGFLGYTAFTLFGAKTLATLCGLVALLGGPVGLFYMYKLYRIKARPFWDHWQTATTFVGSAISLGGLTIAVYSRLIEEQVIAELQLLFAIVFVGLLVESIGHLFHARDLQKGEGEGAASWYEQVTRFGYPFIIRNVLLALALMLSAVAVFKPLSLVGIGVLVLLMFVSAAISRSLFFALVIPTTMPGAFFWKNEEFQEHARETGLADMEQVGVVYERHAEFKLDELVETIKTTSIKEMIEHIKGILIWKDIK